MSVFDDLDAMALDAVMGVFGDLCTLHPMKPGPAGINGPSVADPERATLEAVPVVRSEWAERASVSGRGEGLGAFSGAFKVAVAGQRHIATIKPGDLAWTPGKGDELSYDDEPAVRFRISEPQPDGLSGLHLVLTRI